ncbi:MAG: GNAT family N-acetyltransferase [Cryobacterium sp.]|nr:GNAT family N-acetyltransferase [Cryobacterium sp.]
MIEVHPATSDRFADVGLVLAPKNPDAPACWCLSYRISNQEQRTLAGRERPARLRRYAEEGTPPGVIAYVDGEPAGWCSVAPRASHHRLTHSRTIPTVDDAPVWSVICIVIRPAFRRQGLSRPLLEGAVDYARSQGAPVLEAYPIDPDGRRVSSAFAYVGTTALFESIGFERVIATESKSAGMTRWLMHRSLTT